MHRMHAVLGRSNEGGTLAGHLVECGSQGTGGLFTDWKSHGWGNMGYPIVEVQASGEFVLSRGLEIQSERAWIRRTRQIDVR